MKIRTIFVLMLLFVLVLPTSAQDLLPVAEQESDLKQANLKGQILYVETTTYSCKYEFGKYIKNDSSKETIFYNGRGDIYKEIDSGFDECEKYYNYDSSNRLLEINEQKNEKEQISRKNYTYFPNGKIQEINEYKWENDEWELTNKTSYIYTINGTVNEYDENGILTTTTKNDNTSIRHNKLLTMTTTKDSFGHTIKVAIIPTKLGRHISVYGQHPNTVITTYKYNKFGDKISVTYLSKNSSGTTVESNIVEYSYMYDNHNNWVTCKSHCIGHPNLWPSWNKRKIIYINDK